ncbi:sensor histidine kinase [Dactylosporangium matsuzakiense]|uniref:Anti-sigma regulatory factor n=1 Tax=Dactylosporangium matsuzakiense TaxID=53360 RepID=A0A9W6KRA7_9ACTN|nr:sensor histidine kinase [Dactylosporangium matsuzakiense]UWZ41319.1 sensor histidine kinase [Dactylosporangium matsuzakiense]GLL05700.1 anti-sigma regulatory factor [Dactylosporangium matsuzakiense]
MRSGPALGHSGLFHEAAFYGSDDEFLAVVVPFLRDGVAAGEPTVSLFGPHNQRLVRSVFGPDSGVEFIDGGRHYLRPASAIRRHRDMLARYVDAGAVQIRIAGDVPHPGVGVPWEWWARYESAVNEVYDEFPMYGLCPYDTRTAPREILDDVQRTHTHMVGADGHRRPSGMYQPPRQFLTSGVTSWTEPLQSAAPAIELLDPSPARARDAVGALRAVAALSEEEFEGLVVAVSEAVTNAIRHGLAPVHLRGWARGGRAVVTVTDAGPGPANPVAGLMPDREPGGLGLWLMHQLCAYVSLQRGPEGFTVRLVAEDPDGA